MATPTKIILATRNKKKVAEFVRMFKDSSISFLDMDAFPGCPEVVEDGHSFQENADKKALAVALYSGCTALADDSGLVVDALGGNPGVHSARFAGPHATDEENLRLLLSRLQGKTDQERGARFECVLSLSDPEGHIRRFSGTVFGSIVTSPQGANGFGYDPVFRPQGEHLTFAEMPAWRKDQMSHRGQALAAFMRAMTPYQTSRPRHCDRLRWINDNSKRRTSIMSKLVPPHGGGELKPLLLSGTALSAAMDKAKSLETVMMTSRESGDLIMLGIGAFTPLDGFMNQADWEGVCKRTKLANGVFWPIPVTLSTTKERAAGLRIGQEVALVDEETQEIRGILTVEEKYAIDKKLECESVFQTSDMEHPGVQKVMGQGDVNIGGPVVVLSEGEYPVKYKDIYMRPAETRALFEKKGWSNVAAFQTRNPMHRSHEFLAKIAVEILDGVLIHSVLGKLKSGDIPGDVRARSIDVLIENYFVKDTVVQAGYPMEMRYAGPKEALLHALFRQNFGCSHLIVGRDHAGVGDYYGPFDAQYIFDQVPESELKTRPLKIDWTFFCYKCQGMASMKTCPHGKNDRLLLSGTALRKTLSEGGQPPPEFSRPEVVKILQEYYATIGDDDKVEIKLNKAATG